MYFNAFGEIKKKNTETQQKPKLFRITKYVTYFQGHQVPMEKPILPSVNLLVIKVCLFILIVFQLSRLGSFLAIFPGKNQYQNPFLCAKLPKHLPLIEPMPERFLDQKSLSLLTLTLTMEVVGQGKIFMSMSVNLTL